MWGGIFAFRWLSYSVAGRGVVKKGKVALHSRVGRAPKWSHSPFGGVLGTFWKRAFSELLLSVKPIAKNPSENPPRNTPQNPSFGGLQDRMVSTRVVLVDPLNLTGIRV